ncbi:MAG: hypothetical protein L0Y38_10245 [Methylococcaceae bacterium]|nr:hypothetical protein [Methylococcaceae bacterium]
MKINSIIITLACVSFAMGCGQSDKINASSDRSLYRSVSGVERTLAEKEQVEFQVSFWSLKQYAKSEIEFREMVHRKTAPEIIELGKRNFATQYESGNPDFTKYASWDAMIGELVEERKQSELRPKKSDPRDNDNLIHNM